MPENKTPNQNDVRSSNTDSSSSNYLRWTLNTGAKIGIISSAVSAVKAPADAIILRFMENKGKGEPFIRVKNNNWKGMVIASTLFTGFRSNWIAGQQRGALSVTAQSTNSQQNETGSALYQTIRKPYVQALLYAQGDQFSKVFAEKAKLENAKIISKKNPMKWNVRNTWELFRVGYPLRSTAASGNFLSICIFTNYLAETLPIKNEVNRNFAAGALAGVVAATASHFPHSFADSVLLETTVNKGQLSCMTTAGFFKMQANNAKKIGFNNTITPFVMNSLRGLPVRTANSMLVFAMIQGLGESLGNEPLRFFYNNKDDDSHNSSFNRP